MNYAKVAFGWARSISTFQSGLFTMTNRFGMTHRVAALCLCLCSAAVTGGCLAVAAGAAAGAGTYAYVTGELSTVQEVPLDRAWSAAKSTVNDLQFTIKEEAKDALQARLISQQADQTEVKILLDAQGDKVTKIRVRIGVFGDEATSRLILDKIKAKL
jgi:hypothetical protein